MEVFVPFKKVVVFLVVVVVVVVAVVAKTYLTLKVFCHPTRRWIAKFVFCNFNIRFFTFKESRFIPVKVLDLVENRDLQINKPWAVSLSSSWVRPLSHRHSGFTLLLPNTTSLAQSLS